MDLIGLVILLIVVGAALYIVPMDAGIKRAVIVVVLVVVALVLLRTFLPSVSLNPR